MASTVVASWSEIDCSCGCGEKTKGGTFKQGHNRRVPSSQSSGSSPRQLLSRAYIRRKQSMLAARAVLGGKCVRCGITNPLEWDHINDDGYMDSRMSAGGYRRKPGLTTLCVEFNSIIRTGRSDKLQLLYPNCNQLKKLNRAEFDRPLIYGMI